jgi:hypothetical protein
LGCAWKSEAELPWLEDAKYVKAVGAALVVLKVRQRDRRVSRLVDLCAEESSETFTVFVRKGSEKDRFDDSVNGSGRTDSDGERGDSDQRNCPRAFPGTPRVPNRREHG